MWYPCVVAGPPIIRRYAFVIDGRGRTLHHPLMPSRFRESSLKDRPLLDIADLETATKAKTVIEYMKRSLYPGHKVVVTCLSMCYYHTLIIFVGNLGRLVHDLFCR